MNRNDLSSRREHRSFSFVRRLAVWALLLPALLLPQTGRAGTIVLSEILVANESAYVPFPSTNPGYTPDYIELFYLATAPEDTAIDLGGWTLASTRDADTNMIFQAGTVIAPNSSLLIYLDDRTELPGIHAGFSIRASRGDLVALTNNFGQLVDSVRFGIQITNYSIGRFPLPGDPMQLNVPTPGGANAGALLGDPSKLRANEWQPLGDGTKTGRDTNDWIEIYNGDSNVVALAGLVLTDNPADVISDSAFEELSFIAPYSHAVIYLMGDEENANDADELDDFSLSSANGDHIYIYGSDRATQYDHVVTAPVPPANVGRTEGRVPDGGPAITFLAKASPGAPNFGTINEIVISEVLPHTDLPLEDAIELQNVTGTNVNIGDWWLTNDPDVPKKFRIPTGTIVPPGGFVVFYEGRKAAVGFNRNGSDRAPYFTLNSARGDEVYLFKGLPDGSLTGDRRGIDFGPSQNGVSFGRYVTSTGEADIVAMKERTFGQDNPASVTQFRLGTGKTNSDPKIGPVIITEIQYDIGTIDENLFEFVEIRNMSDDVVPLYDPAYPTNQWRLKDGVDFTFPPNQTLAPDEYALIVNFDPADTLLLNGFRLYYPNIPPTTKIYGPYGGSLNNNEDTVELAKPDAPQAAGRVDAGLVPYYVIDRVKYKNDAPWPEVENTGRSLQRIADLEYGNDPINWRGIEILPTPGQFNTALGVEALRITAQPQNQTAKELFNTSFTVRARGSDRSYQWTLNGTNIDHGTNATLEIVGVSLGDAGVYQVTLSNAAGTVTSAEATLTVEASPADTTPPTIAIVSPANNARVTGTNSTITLKGTATENTAIDRIEYKVGDGEFLTATGRTVWGAQVELQPGTNVIIARAINTSGNMATSKVHRLVYVVTSSLNLSVTGNGTVSGATHGQLLEVGRSYTITAKPATGFVFSNWTGGVSGSSPKLTFPMESNLVVVANFVPNPFAPIDGKYNGLFYDANDLRHGSSGFFTLTVTERGSYSAALTVGGRRHSTSGILDLEGRGTNTIVRSGTNALGVRWAVAMDGSDTVTGVVSNGIWSADLSGDRATFSRTSPNTNAGKYTFLIPGTPGDITAPEGDSYGTVSIDANGNVSTKGFLADKTSISQKVPLSKNGHWPFFASLYSGKGSILGWLSLSNSAGEFQGNVNWSKPALATSKYYPDGFNNLYAALGSRYVAPGANRILDLPAAEVVMTGGNLAQAQTNQIVIESNNKVINNTPEQKLVLTFVTPSGLFKGNFTPVGAIRSVPIAGAVLQNTSWNYAAGYFLGTNRSGRIVIQAPAP